MVNSFAHEARCHVEHSGDSDRPFQAIPITHSDLIPISVARVA
jgi:hypothetical protein